MLSPRRYLAVYKPLGVLIIMVEEMMQDVLNFIVLFLVVTFAFALGLAPGCSSRLPAPTR
jgi:hypothetical protein